MCKKNQERERKNTHQLSKHMGYFSAKNSMEIGCKFFCLHPMFWLTNLLFFVFERFRWAVIFNRYGRCIRFILPILTTFILFGKLKSTCVKLNLKRKINWLGLFSHLFSDTTFDPKNEKSIEWKWERKNSIIDSTYGYQNFFNKICFQPGNA